MASRTQHLPLRYREAALRQLAIRAEQAKADHQVKIEFPRDR